MHDRNDQQSVIVKTVLAASSLFRRLPEMACQVQAWGKAHSVLRMQDVSFPSSAHPTLLLLPSTNGKHSS